MANLAQYYTHSFYSELLISKFNQVKPNIILELGTGEGSLLKAAKSRWSFARIFGLDLDEVNVTKSLTVVPDAIIYNSNGLSNKITSILNLKAGTVDIAICNPPYLSTKIQPKYSKLFSNVGLSLCNKLPLITTDLIFLSQNLKMLKNGGELGIILPDTLLTSHHFELFRKAVIHNHRIDLIIQLPDNCFRKTEAQTHILFITKFGGMNSSVPILLADNNGKIIEEILVDADCLEHRMDFNYHKWRLGNKNNSSVVLEKLGVQILRGKLSSKQVKDSSSNIFHTTSFPSANFSNIDLPNFDFDLNDGPVAQKGDILLARVGKRCVGKLARVHSGKQLVSDCVLIIRVEEKYQNLVWESLVSDEGQAWIKGNLHGVCAQIISKTDLLKFSVNF